MYIVHSTLYINNLELKATFVLVTMNNEQMILRGAGPVEHMGEKRFNISMRGNVLCKL